MKGKGNVALSIVIPALNEASNLEASVREVVSGVPASLTHEILIFDDGSSDGTGAIADSLAREFPSVCVIHNPKTMGLGYNYAAGVRGARGKFVMMVPGDNEIRFSSLRQGLEQLGSYDIVIPYISNPQVRPWVRRFLSKTYTFIFNLIFGLKVKYFNGPCIHRTEFLKRLPMESAGFAYMAQILVRLIKSGATYTHAPMELRPRGSGSTKAFAPKNILSVGQTFFSLVREVYFPKKGCL